MIGVLPGSHADMPDSTPPSPELVAVLDMGASAIRLAVAEVGAGGALRVIEDVSRGVLLGRDTFSSGRLRAETIEAALVALDGFHAIMRSYGVSRVRAVATSAVREASNGDLFLDRVAGRTGITFEAINEGEESRLVYLALKHDLARHAVFKGARTLLVEVGGGSTSLTLLTRGQPDRSGVYALGSVRLRQRLDLSIHGHDLQVALLKRYVANVIEEIRLEIPLRRVTHMSAIGGDIRFAASQILDADADGIREIPRDAFLAFCDEVERLDEDGLVERFRLPAVDAETLMPGLLIYRALLHETSVKRLVVSEASLRVGVLLDLATPAGALAASEFDQQVLASADALGRRYRYDQAHGRHVAELAGRLFDELRDEHRLGDRERLLLQVAALLHDIGVYVSLRAHHKHSQYLLSSSQIFGLSDDETAIVSNIARYHRAATPQRSHLPYIALDRGDRLVVDKLASILRLANALDAEHLQRVRDVQVRRADQTWIIALEGTGDLTMERMAAQSRTDMLAATFGRQVVIQTVDVVA